MPPIATVRAWAVTIFACAAIVLGLIHNDSTAVMLGFSMLGAEPTYRAAKNGKLNGP